MHARFPLALAAVVLLSGCAPVAQFFEGPPDSRQPRSVPPHERRALATADVSTTPVPSPTSAAPDAPVPASSLPPTVLVSEAAPRPASRDLPPLALAEADEDGALDAPDGGAPAPTTPPATAPAAGHPSPASALAPEAGGSVAADAPRGPVTSEPIALPARPAAPADAPAPAPGTSEQLPRNVFDLHTVYFKTDSVELTRAARDLLEENAAMLRDNRRVHVVVEGHTDAAGSPRYNQDLARRRAEAVVEYLVGRGIARERLDLAVYGQDRPVDPAPTPAARAKNRRVQFLVYFPDLGSGPPSSSRATP